MWACGRMGPLVHDLGPGAHEADINLVYVVFTQRTSSPKGVGMFRDHQDAYLNGVLVRGGLGCPGVLVRGELVLEDDLVGHADLVRKNCPTSISKRSSSVEPILGINSLAPSVGTDILLISI
ncbi:hypothetical protein ACE6H2_001838 [Prunus campanulata]